ncbi:MAG: DUF6338 family protein [Bacteroidota bacterium]
MEISEFTLKLIILLIPGAIASILIEALTIHKSWSVFKFILNAVLLGGFSYLILQVVNFIFHSSSCDPNKVLDIWGVLVSSKSLPFDEILWGVLISIFVGFGLSAIIYYKLIFKLSKWLRISYKFGDDSLFYTFLNSPDIYPIYVRDIKNGKTYHGYVDRFSENDLIKEIALRDVDVYDYETSDFLYKVPRLYISKSQIEDLIIEVPNLNESNDAKTKQSSKTS